MFLLYHSEGCNSSGGLFRKCYVNDLHTTTCSGMLGHRTATRKPGFWVEFLVSTQKAGKWVESL
jgi:hypothetical protein